VAITQQWQQAAVSREQAAAGQNVLCCSPDKISMDVIQRLTQTLSVSANFCLIFFA
jgi:hypothetical protein